MLDKELKAKLVKKFGKSDKDVGSVEVQVAMLTGRIQQISKHLETYPKDKHSRAGLLKVVGKRNKFLRYLKLNDKSGFDNVTKQLKI